IRRSLVQVQQEEPLLETQSMTGFCFICRRFYLSKVLSIENRPTPIALLPAKERQTVKFALEKLSA
ncbi:TPA: hypothetical protein ACMDPH_003872, partial [Vibrio cholerae]